MTNSFLRVLLLLVSSWGFTILNAQVIEIQDNHLWNDSLFISNEYAYDEYLDYRFCMKELANKNTETALFGSLTVASALFILYNKPAPDDVFLGGLRETIENIAVGGIGCVFGFFTLDSTIRASRAKSRAIDHLENAIDYINDEVKSHPKENSLGLGITTNGIGLVYSF